MSRILDELENWGIAIAIFGAGAVLSAGIVGMLYLIAAHMGAHGVLCFFGIVLLTLLRCAAADAKQRSDQ